jgi:alkylated DNA nucleotide flippase Atl1
MDAEKIKRDWKDGGLAVCDVPEGKVSTYGDVSEALYGDRRKGARAVGKMMETWEADEPEKNLAHRVVTDDGTPAFPHHAAKLKTEGVPFDSQGRVQVDKCRAKLISQMPPLPLPVDFNP